MINFPDNPHVTYQKLKKEVIYRSTFFSLLNIWYRSFAVPILTIANEVPQYEALKSDPATVRRVRVLKLRSSFPWLLMLSLSTSLR